MLSSSLVRLVTQERLLVARKPWMIILTGLLGRNADCRRLDPLSINKVSGCVGRALVNNLNDVLMKSGSWGNSPVLLNG